MSNWFEGYQELDCQLEQVKQSLEDTGEYFLGVTKNMPGLTLVELVDQGSDFVTIRTNEGLMKRTNISKKFDTGSVSVEYDEEYQAGSMVTARTHFRDEFTAGDSGVNHRLIISSVIASGLLGFLYRTFAKSSTGNALLNSTKTYFEALNT